MTAASPVLPTPRDRPLPPSWRVLDARDAYLAENEFTVAAYDAERTDASLGPLRFSIPNTRRHRWAIRLHDLHHVITGYTTYWKGEVEIGAWELGGGCGRYWVAWLLNAEVAFIGLFLYPRSLFRAFRAGRAVPNNLYHGVAYDGLLDRSMGELRRSILLRQAP